MIAKDIAEITERDLAGLVDAKATESKTLEFKRQLPDGTDQGKIKFLRSVTAFANTIGGDLIYGIEELDGMASGVAPLDLKSTDVVLQRLEQLCANGVAPRLTGLVFRFIPLSSGCALVVRVPRSWDAPHRVTLAGHSHFYGRCTTSAFPLDVGELRQAFTLAASTAERIRAFRADRLLALSTGTGSVPIQSSAVAVLHVVPLQAFATDLRIDLASRSHALDQIHPLGSSGFDMRLNVDGRLSYRSNAQGHCFGYAQLFRNGIIEAVDGLSPLGTGGKIFASESYESDVLRALNSYLPALSALGVATPAYVFYSMLGVAGYRLSTGYRLAQDNYPLVHDSLILPEVVVTDWQQDTGLLMRPTFDIVWNAFGFDRSYNYNDKGEWVGQRR